MLTITLKSHKNVTFSNVKSVAFCSTVQSAIDDINQYRSTAYKIAKLYNPYGQEIEQSLWKIQVKESMVFYIDTP
jgi:hypothetical protein